MKRPDEIRANADDLVAGLRLRDHAATRGGFISRISRPNGRTLVMLIIMGLALALVGAFELSRYPSRKAEGLRRQIAALPDSLSERRLALETVLLQYETDGRIKIWTAIVQAAGGAALLLGLVFTARNLQATQVKLEIDRQGQLTNRFIQATSQLGAEAKGGERNVEVRLGGIYALNRISKDWPADYWPIANILTAYVRHNAVWSESPDEVPTRRATDIQAILSVLGHDPPPVRFADDRKFDLRFTDLRGLEFYDAHFEWTDFYGAHLNGAQLWGAVLRHAKLDKADLAGANLREAKLDDASLEGAILEGAMLKDASLERANLRGAKLKDASLEGANLKGAVFNNETEWPAGIDAHARGAVLV